MYDFDQAKNIRYRSGPPRAELDAFSVVFRGEKAYTFPSKDRGPVEQTTPRWWWALDRQAAIDRPGLLLTEEAG